MNTDLNQHIAAIKRAAQKRNMGLFSSGKNRFDDAVDALASVFSLSDTQIQCYSLLALYYPDYTHEQFMLDIQGALIGEDNDQNRQSEIREFSAPTLISVLILNALDGNTYTPEAYSALYKWISREAEEREFRFICEKHQISNEVWNHLNTFIDYCNEQLQLLPNNTLPLLRIVHRVLCGQRAIADITNTDEITNINRSIHFCNKNIESFNLM